MHKSIIRKKKNKFYLGKNKNDFSSLFSLYFVRKCTLKLNIFSISIQSNIVFVATLNFVMIVWKSQHNEEVCDKTRNRNIQKYFSVRYFILFFYYQLHEYWNLNKIEMMLYYEVHYSVSYEELGNMHTYHFLISLMRSTHQLNISKTCRDTLYEITHNIYI